MRKNKFRPGDRYEDLSLLKMDVFDLHRYVYFNHKPLHPRWIMSMTFQTVVNALTKGMLREALPNA